MLKHEHFEEISAAASIGQASGAELAELQVHLADCPECQQAYSEFLAINADHYATRATERELGRDEAVECIDSALFRERFLKEAEAQGIVFSGASTVVKLPAPEMRTPKRSQWAYGVGYAAVAAIAIACVGVGGYYVGVRGRQPSPVVAAVPVTARSSAAQTQDPRLNENARLASLQGEVDALTADIGGLKTSLDSERAKAADLKASGSRGEEERRSLVTAISVRDASIADLQRRLDQAQFMAANVRAELERTRSSSAGDQASLIEARVKVQDLSAQLAEKSSALDREREMLTAGRDVRELMSARNLHIVDVFDTDPKGKTRRSFGRIFLTEGKSLLFYAYDLNDRRVEEAGFKYRIWGKKEGPGQRAHNLGIFYSDDKAQKRWVFQYDDPKVLNEIDSVFVTLEPPNGNPAQPKGEKLMYAYLRGQPNHP